MSSAVATRPMPKPRKDAPKRNDSPAKIDAEVIDHAKVVAAMRKITLAEYLSEALRPIVARDLEQDLAKLSQATRPGRAKAKPETRGS